METGNMNISYIYTFENNFTNNTALLEIILLTNSEFNIN